MLLLLLPILVPLIGGIFVFRQKNEQYRDWLVVSLIAATAVMVLLNCIVPTRRLWLLTIQGDKLDTFAKVRGMKQAKAKMIEALKEDRFTRFGQVPDGELRIETAGTFESRQEAEQWRRMVQAEFPTVQVSYVDLPCSIACHVGINAVGTGIVKKEII